MKKIILSIELLLKKMFVLYVIVFLTIENKNPYDVSKMMNIYFKLLQNLDLFQCLWMPRMNDLSISLWKVIFFHKIDLLPKLVRYKVTQIKIFQLNWL